MIPTPQAFSHTTPTACKAATRLADLIALASAAHAHELDESTLHASVFGTHALRGSREVSPPPSGSLHHRPLFPAIGSV